MHTCLTYALPLISFANIRSRFIQTMKPHVVLMLFCRSDVQNKAFQAVREAREKKKKYDNHVYISVDIQENVNPNIKRLPSDWVEDSSYKLEASNSYHIVGDWETQYNHIKRHFVIDILISNSPCTYNTRLSPKNHYQAGISRNDAMKDDYIERRKLQHQWMKCVHHLLTDDSSNYRIKVILCENPSGYMDSVVTYKKQRPAYDEVHPYHFLDNHNFKEEDNRMKRTHWFSGGNKAAIKEVLMASYIKQNEPRKDVQKDWVLKMSDSNERSELSPGMGNALAEVALARHDHAVIPSTSDKHIIIEFHEEQIFKQPTDSCGSPLLNDNGNIMKDRKGNHISCNLRRFHNNGGYFNIQNATLCCMHWDYGHIQGDPFGLSPNRIVHFGQSIILEKDRDRKPTTPYQPIDFKQSNDSQQCGECHEPDSQMNNYSTRKVYNCKKCGLPKKGHICSFIDKFRKSPIRKVYHCKKCGLPKKGHICLRK